MQSMEIQQESDAIEGKAVGRAVELLTIAGPVIGATVLVVLPEALRFSAQMREILIGVTMLTVVLFLPAGLVGLLMVSRRSVAS